MRATWLFFDMGSTIMNETPAMEKRIRDSIAGTDVTYEAFATKMAEFRALGVREDLATFDYFGITERTPWPRDTEEPYPDADRVLRTLRERGYRLGIIASQPLGSEQRLARFGLRDYFEVICASAEEGVDKPDPVLFRRALTRAGCAPGDAVMIGDRLHDIHGAHENGILAIGVTWGYGSEAELREAGADAIAHWLDELEMLI